MRSSSAWTTPLAALCALFAACSEPAPPLPASQPKMDAAPALTTPAPATVRAPEPATPSPAETCAGNWLAHHGLNPYGDPPGTMYPGATPLFNERTGQRTPRLDYLFARHADLRADCAPAPASAPGAQQKQ